MLVIILISMHCKHIYTFGFPTTEYARHLRRLTDCLDAGLPGSAPGLDFKFYDNSAIYDSPFDAHQMTIPEEDEIPEPGPLSTWLEPIIEFEFESQLHAKSSEGNASSNSRNSNSTTHSAYIELGFVDDATAKSPLEVHDHNSDIGSSESSKQQISPPKDEGQRSWEVVFANTSYEPETTPPGDDTPVEMTAPQDAMAPAAAANMDNSEDTITNSEDTMDNSIDTTSEDACDD